MGKALRVESVCADAHANEIATPGEQQKRPRFSAEKKGKGFRRHPQTPSSFIWRVSPTGGTDIIKPVKEQPNSAEKRNRVVVI
jgi:hypothetical protein